jgi:hypothetical protein
LIPQRERFESPTPLSCRVTVFHHSSLLLTLLPGWSIADWHLMGPVPNVGISELVREGQQWRALRMNELPERVASL